jgi:hypothetical protein
MAGVSSTETGKSSNVFDKSLPGAYIVIDAKCGYIVGAQDGARRVEMTRRREDQPGAAGLQRRLELLRVCQIIDRHQHPARAQSSEGCGDPGRRVRSPERDCAAFVNSTFTQAAR